MHYRVIAVTPNRSGVQGTALRQAIHIPTRSLIGPRDKWSQWHGGFAS